MKNCERCQYSVRRAGDRFCDRCKQKVKEEMRTSGYLTDAVPLNRKRSEGEKELVYETKFGDGHG